MNKINTGNITHLGDKSWDCCKNLAYAVIEQALADYLLDKMNSEQLSGLDIWCNVLDIDIDYIEKEFKRLYIASIDEGFVATRKYKGVTKKYIVKSIMREYQRRYAGESNISYLQN